MGDYRWEDPHGRSASPA